jgi:hypothetical protein
MSSKPKLQQQTKNRIDASERNHVTASKSRYKKGAHIYNLKSEYKTAT